MTARLHVTWAILALALTLPALTPARASAATSPYPQSTVIFGMTLDFTKHVRRASSSDNWPLTWAANDHQYASWGDGFGFDGGTTKMSLGYSRIEGPAVGFTARDTYGSEGAEARSSINGKSYAILSLGGTLYSFVSPGSGSENLVSSTLYKSTDGGHSWTATSVQFTSSTHGLALPGFLQFGKDYAQARDTYVYAYWTKVKTVSWATQKPGEIILTRVPRTSIETQSQYQYYAGTDGSGNPIWSTSISAMRPVFVDPNGVLTNSAIYNPGLGRYLLVTNHTLVHAGHVAVFESANPWGPWGTVAYYNGWPSGGEVPATTFYANFAPKWFSSNGVDFVFVFTGTGSNDAWNSVPGSFITTSNAPSGEAHWRFDEGGGGVAADIGGQSLNGALIGPTWTTGVLDGGLRFDGSNDLVQVPDPGTGSTLDLGANFTLAAWANFSSLPVSGSAAYPRLFQKGTSTGDAGSYYFAVATGGSPVVSLRLKFGGTVYTWDGVRALSTGQWYHLAAIKQGGVVRLYVNGVQDGGDRSCPSGMPDANNEPLHIGEAPDNGDGAMSGVLDDARVFTRALTASEILGLSGLNEEPTVSAGPDRTVSLAAGASLDGTVTDDGLPGGTLSTVWTVTSGPSGVTFAQSNSVDTQVTFATTGTYILRLTANDGDLQAFDEVQVTVTPNQTLEPLFQDHLTFDGHDDYVQVQDPGSGSALDLGSSFTMSAWVNFFSLQSTGAARNPRLLQKGSSTGDAGSYYLSVNTVDAPRVVSLRLKFGGTAYTYQGIRSLSTGQWYHVAATKQGSVVRLYVNGSQDGGDFTVPSGAPDANGEPLYVGESPDNSDGCLGGAIEDIRMYDSALSAADIVATMTTPLAGDESGLVLYLALNDGTGQSVTDGSLSALTAWRGATTSSDASDPLWAHGSTTTGVEEAETAVPIASGPLALRLRSATGVTPVAFSVEGLATGEGDVLVHDVHGRLVTRYRTRIAEGERLAWDARHADGRRASSGVYFIRVVVGSREGSVKTMIVR